MIRDALTSFGGAPRLRGAIADKYRRFYDMDVDPERHVTVCCGSTETMLATLLAVLNPGDEVIVFEPFYENYGPGCIIAGAEPVWVPLEPPDFSFDPDRLRRAVSPRTRAIIFNSPNNPSGKVFSRQELGVITDLCLERDQLAITDEIYEHIVYPGARDQTSPAPSAAASGGPSARPAGGSLGTNAIPARSSRRQTMRPRVAIGSDSVPPS